MTRKHGHWGTTEEAKAWATRARRRAEVAELRQELERSAAQEPTADHRRPAPCGC